MTSSLRTSESIDAFSTAFVAAQAEIETAPKDKVNPHFKSRYANLTAVADACRAALAKHGLGVLQAPGFADGRLRMTTRILHKSGQWMESDLDLKPKNDTPQDIGSAITYARRYALGAMLGVMTEEDDDGNAASGRKPEIDEKVKKEIYDAGYIAGVKKTLDDFEKQKKLFNKDDFNHVERLGVLLEKKNVASHLHVEVANMLHGKPMVEKTVDEIIGHLEG